jgi:hypothetical protein
MFDLSAGGLLNVWLSLWSVSAGVDPDQRFARPSSR